MRKATRQRVRAANRARSPARNAHECARTKTTLFCILRQECDESGALAPFAGARELDGRWRLVEWI
jgi:hypothetical protein